MYLDNAVNFHVAFLCDLSVRRILVLQDPNEVMKTNETLHGPRNRGLPIGQYIIPQLSWLGYDFNERKNLTKLRAFIDHMVKR